MSQKTFKLVFLGDSSVGKSSVITRKVQDKFDEYLEPTIGAAFLSTSIKVGESTVTLQIWDTAGQERYKSLAPMYYRGAHAAVIVYDITNYDSFKGATHWVQELYKNDSKTTIFLVGNKIDKVNSRKVSIKEVKDYSIPNKLKHIEVSAKNGDNINVLFNQIADQLNQYSADYLEKQRLELDKKNNHKDPKRFRNSNCCYS